MGYSAALILGIPINAGKMRPNLIPCFVCMCIRARAFVHDMVALSLPLLLINDLRLMYSASIVTTICIVCMHIYMQTACLSGCDQTQTSSTQG